MKLKLQAEAESSRNRLEVGKMYLELIEKRGGRCNPQALQALIADTSHAMLTAEPRNQRERSHRPGCAFRPRREDDAFSQGGSSSFEMVSPSAASSNGCQEEPQGQQIHERQAAASSAAAQPAEQRGGSRRKSHHQRQRQQK